MMEHDNDTDVKADAEELGNVDNPLMQKLTAKIDPIQVFEKDLFDSDVKVQLDAIQNIGAVILALPKNKKGEVLNVLKKYCFDNYDENGNSELVASMIPRDEVLKEIAIECVGSVLPLIEEESYSKVDDGAVRKAAIDGLVGCAAQIQGAFVHERVFPIIRKLASMRQWTARVGAAVAGPRIFKYMTETECKEPCINMVLRLMSDEMPLVREELYANIPWMIPSMKQGDLSARQFMVDILKALLSVKEMDIIDIIRENFDVILKDVNWRVRGRLYDNIVDMAKLAPPSFTNNELWGGILKGLEDSEPIIKSKVAKLLLHFEVYCSDKKMMRRSITLDLLQNLLLDDALHVREAVSEVIMDIILKMKCGTSGVQMETLSEEYREWIIIIMRKLYNDEEEGVRMKFCTSLATAYALCGAKRTVVDLLPLIFKLQHDPSWRVRKGVLETMELYIQLVNEDLLPIDDVIKLLWNGLGDNVDSVRECCSKIVPKLVGMMGSKWVLEKVFRPIVRDFYECENNKYHLRIVALRVAWHLLCDVDEKELTDELQSGAIDLICEGFRDTISNCRIVSLDALINLLRAGKQPAFVEAVRLAVPKLCKDENDEVRYLGSVALDLLNISDQQ